MILVEVPYIVFTTTIAFLSLYWTSGLNKQNSPENAFYLWISMTVWVLYCVAFGQSVAAACVHIFQAIVILPVLVSFLFLFCGVLNPPQSLPAFW